MKVAGATMRRRSCWEGGMEAGRQPRGQWWAGEERQGWTLGCLERGSRILPAGGLEFGKRQGAGSRLDGGLEHPEKHAVS